MTEDTINHQVLGIIDESEPETEVVPADADYSRDDEAGKSDSPSEDATVEATPDEDKSQDADDSVEVPEDPPAKDTDREGESGEGEGKGPVSFAGREWESYEAAAQSFKSFDGRVRAAEERSTDYEKRLADYYEYVQKVGEENRTLREQLTGEAPTEKSTSAQNSAVAPSDVDMAKILRVAKLAEERGIDPVEAALKLYHLESKTVMDARLAEMEKKLSAPLEEMESTAQEAQAERELFKWAQDLKGDDGHRYPLLQPGENGIDETFVGNVYEAWRSLGEKFGATYAYSQTGIDQAYRLAHEFGIQSGTIKPETPAQKPPRKNASRDLANADALAASDLTGETPSINRPKKTPGKQALEDLGNHSEVTIGGENLGFYE